MQLPESRREWIVAIALPALPLLVAVLVLIVELQPVDPLRQAAPALKAIAPDSVEDLQARFDSHDYSWPPEDMVPALGVKAFPEGLAELAVDERKSLFFRTLLPLVVAENERIRRLREQALAIHGRLEADAGAPLTEAEQELMARLFERYRIDGDWRDSGARTQLFRRLDIVPPALVLAQAANESGWGTSHFTRVANNLFGEWTWDESAGVLPRQRVEGATHYVRNFPDLRSAVRGYIWNINVGHAYRELRALRASLDEPDGIALAGGLTRYSERGEAYVAEIRSMIRFNDLDQLPPDLELD